MKNVQFYEHCLGWYVCACCKKCTSLQVLFRGGMCEHAMENVQVYECYLGWYVCAHYEKFARPWVLLRVACIHTLYMYYPYWAGQCKNEGKGIIYRYSQWRLLNKDQRNVSLFLISSTKTRTAPFKKNGPIALTTGWDVCEVFWKHYFNQRRNWYRATTWEKATRGTTYCRTSSGQQLGDWPRYEKTVPFSASPWSTVMGWTMTWGQDTRRQCHSKRWTTTQEEDTRRQCHSDACHLVHREGVDDGLRRGHEKAVPIRRKSPGLLWSGGRWPEERTREDSANQTRVPWSTVKGWTTIGGEDPRRQCQSDTSPLVHPEGLDDNLRRGHEKTVPIRWESPGPPWSGGRRPEERTREDSANQARVPWSTVKGWTMT